MHIRLQKFHLITFSSRRRAFQHHHSVWRKDLIWAEKILHQSMISLNQRLADLTWYLTLNPTPNSIPSLLFIPANRTVLTWLSERIRKSELRPYKHNQDRQQSQPRNPRIQHQSPPPSLPLTHTSQHAHFLARLLQARRILIHALCCAIHYILLVFQRGGECF